MGQNSTSTRSLMPGAMRPRREHSARKKGVEGSTTWIRRETREVLVMTRRCVCTLPTSYPPKCMTGGRTEKLAFDPTAVYVPARRFQDAAGEAR